MKNIKLDYNDHIAVVTISRPEQFNAVNMETILEISEAFDKIGAFEDLRCVIITGEGKSFVAGADIKELESLNKTQAYKLSETGNITYMKIQNFKVPVIAAVNGYSLGGGCELALACDIRIASENAVFALPEASLGIYPGWGGTQRLARLIGYGKAAEMIFTCDKISAQKALEIGLVSSVVPREQLLEAVMELAKKIAANAPIAVAAAKQSMQKGLEVSLRDGVRIEAEGFSKLFETEDAKNGLKAFINKQKYNYLGK